MTDPIFAVPSGFPENRYIVIKESDLYEAGKTGFITIGQLETLAKIKAATEHVRKGHLKHPLTVLILENNWPEYQAAFEALQTRVLAELNATHGG